MSGGLFALLDDVAVFARLTAASLDDVGGAASRATVKAAGVVIDDTAVTPQYVEGIAAERELPIIKRIAVGSLRNKLLLILPGAMVLSQFAPLLLSPVLMLGAVYLCYEGAEKVWGSIRGHDHGQQAEPESEGHMVAGAIRTDFVLSAEIMVIALNEVAELGFVPRLVTMIIVALVITVAVYGVVAAIVRMDDIGLRLARTDSRLWRVIGRGLVAGMPKLLSFLSALGTAAMLWVGGHILLTGSDRLGWHTPYGWVHDAEHAAARAVEPVGAVVSWLTNTAISAVVGSCVGAVAVAVVTLIRVLPFGRRGRSQAGPIEAH